MKRVIALVLATLCTAGCSSTVFVTGSDQYAEINTTGAAHSATITVQTDSGTADVTGDFLNIGADSVHWLNVDAQRGQVDATQNIRSIRFATAGRGAWEGAAMCMVPGALLVGYGFINPSHGSWGNVLPAMGAALAGVGGLIGVTAGALYGHTTEYKFPDHAPSSPESPPRAAHSGPATDTAFRGLPPRPFTALNALYAEGAWMIINGSFSVNYERSLTRSTWLRVGMGAGQNDWFAGYGALVMVMFQWGRNNDKFELGVGGSYSDRYDEYIPSDASLSGSSSQARHIGWLFIPALSAGYRYQPSAGGLIFRAGLTPDYYGGFPAQISVGYAF